MSNLPHLAQQLFNKPLAIHPDKAEVIMAALGHRFGITGIRMGDGRVRAFDEDYDREPAAGYDDCGYEVAAGVALIEVRGTLVQRQMGLRPVSGMTGYNAIRANVLAAVSDPAVKAIALAIDSPGGDVAGLFDLTDTIFSLRGRKPVWAILDEMACSAAYAIAAAANVVTIPRTGYAGSIGVICLHVDLTKMLEKEGMTVTVITYGAHKADGQPMVPLSDAARERKQAEIDTAGELFVRTMARYRGMPATTIRAQEADVFMGAAARAVGLVDAVMSPSDAFAALVKSLN